VKWNGKEQMALFPSLERIIYLKIDIIVLLKKKKHAEGVIRLFDKGLAPLTKHLSV